ncbi:hypothetical protein ACWZEH_19950 [Streptomyces sp. QTS137]
MSELIERDAIPEGYKVEVFDGRVIMTSQSPERYWTVSDVKDAVKASGIARERVFGDVPITFPIDFYMIADPLRTTVTLMSEPHAAGYARVVEIPYGEPVSFTPATGERVEIGTGTFPTRDAGGA